MIRGIFKETTLTQNGTFISISTQVQSKFGILTLSTTGVIRNIYQMHQMYERLSLNPIITDSLRNVNSIFITCLSLFTLFTGAW